MALQQIQTKLQQLKLTSALPNKVIIFLIILAGLGFMDATYLAVEHFLGNIPPCNIASGCESVLTSKYSEIFGIPVALLGSLYYALNLLLLFIYKDSKKDKVILFVGVLTSLGFLASLGFVYLQLFVIKAICLYCMGSAITSTLLFFTLLFELKKRLQTSVV